VLGTITKKTYYATVLFIISSNKPISGFTFRPLLLSGSTGTCLQSYYAIDVHLKIYNYCLVGFGVGQGSHSCGQRFSYGQSSGKISLLTGTYLVLSY
jgi:hypothetical protein